MEGEDNLWVISLACRRVGWNFEVLNRLIYVSHYDESSEDGQNYFLTVRMLLTTGISYEERFPF